MAKKYYNLGDRTPTGRLPKNVRFTTDVPTWEACGDAEDTLSDTYGFCINSCTVTHEYDSSDPNVIHIYVSDIDWDLSE